MNEDQVGVLAFESIVTAIEWWLERLDPEYARLGAEIRRKEARRLLSEFASAQLGLPYTHWGMPHA